MKDHRLQMSKTMVGCCLGCLIATAILLSGCGRNRTRILYGRVVKIADGDTITVVDADNVEFRVRLMGIDAPERKQAYSQISRENLANLIFGKSVTVQYEKLDRYGRIVGKVKLDGNDECLEQIKAGLAWHYKQFEKEQSADDRLAYAKAENEARSNRRGLWQDSDPTPPWAFRHSNRDSNKDVEDETSSNLEVQQFLYMSFNTPRAAMLQKMTIIAPAIIAVIPNAAQLNICGAERTLKLNIHPIVFFPTIRYSVLDKVTNVRAEP